MSMVLACCLLLLIAGCGQGAASPSSRPSKQQETVTVPLDVATGQSPLLATYFQPGLDGPGTPHSPLLLFGIYPGGRMLFSADRLNGGPPCFEKQLSKAEAQAIWQKARTIAAGSPPYQSHTGPDMSRLVIVIRAESAQAYTYLASVHEIYEAAGKSIATQDGLIPLNGRSAEATKAATWTPAYRHFREMWANLRQIENSVATEGEKTDAAIEWGKAGLDGASGN